MMIMGKKIENRTILIIVSILLIVLAGYYIVVSLPAAVDYLTVEDTLRNKDSYINKTIIIRGYYQSAIQSIVSTMSDVTGKSTLTLDYTDVQNASEILRNGIKYDFTGILQEVSVGPDIDRLIFKAIKIEAV
jgi:hypothetical protein